MYDIYSNLKQIQKKFKRNLKENFNHFMNLSNFWAAVWGREYEIVSNLPGYWYSGINGFVPLLLESPLFRLPGFCSGNFSPFVL